MTDPTLQCSSCGWIFSPAPMTLQPDEFYQRMGERQRHQAEHQQQIDTALATGVYTATVAEIRWKQRNAPELVPPELRAVDLSGRDDDELIRYGPHAND